MPANPSTSARKLILAIETSNPASAADPARAAGVAIGRVHPDRDAGGEGERCEVLALEWLTPPARAVGAGATTPPTSPGGPAPLNADDTLLPAIERVMCDAGARPVDLDLVAVSIGPGGYTGVRVACSAGKMLAQAARWLQTDRAEHERCMCVGVASHLVAAAGAMKALDEANRAPERAAMRVRVVMASKGDAAWVSEVIDRRTLNSPGQPSPRLDRANGSIMNPAAWRTALDAEPPEAWTTHIVADQFLPAGLRVAIQACNDAADSRGGEARPSIAIIPPVFDPRVVLDLASRQSVSPIDPEQLNPLYPREPDAVTLWRQRHAST